MYTLATDISGPFSPGVDVGGAKKYFIVFAMRLPVGPEFPWVATPSTDSPAPGKRPPRPSESSPVSIAGEAVVYPPPAFRHGPPLSHQHAARQAAGQVADQAAPLVDIPEMDELFPAELGDLPIPAMRAARADGAAPDF